MSANYVLIEKISVGAAGASSVTFSGIPQTGYTDLVVKMSTRSSYTGYSYGWVSMQMNTSVGSTMKNLYGEGSSTGSFSPTTTQTTVTDAANATSNTFSSVEIYIPNYAGSNPKSFSIDGVSEKNASTENFLHLTAGLFSSSAAITSLTIAPEYNSFVQYTTFYLYGVAKLGTTPAIVPYATGGDTIMTDGTYWYHTFLSSGTFTPQKAISCDYLVVAGGGGGGFSRGAGGGAGGLRSTVGATGGGGSLESALSLGTSAYTVTVGAGGAASTGGKGGSGSNSVFSTITSNGGGGGGSSASSSGLSGGSGGASTDSDTAGTGTANQGYAGGVGVPTAPNYGGGGGGGAGVVGSNGTGTNGGNGGNGISTSISGTSTSYAGGGGGAVFVNGSGGSGGTGGGGAGGTTGPGTNGTANTGGGAGGGGHNGGAGQQGGSGGSGIVVVRYLV
jgi:hypothetical protein